MSNLLEKTVKVVYTLTPGYRVKTWHPAVTTTTYVPPVIWGWDPFFPDTKVYPHYTVPAGHQTFSHWGPYFGIDGEVYNGWRQIDIDQSTGETGYYTSETVAGYYSYDEIPGFRTVTYDPNMGWNSAARSVPHILGDGQGIFSVPISLTGAVVGLNPYGTSSGSDYFEITHGIYFYGGNFYVCESGALKTSVASYTDTDVFTITRKGALIYYAKNDAVFYASTVPLSGELVLDCSLYFAGDQIVDAAIVTTTVVDIYAGTRPTYPGGTAVDPEDPSYPEYIQSILAASALLQPMRAFGTMHAGADPATTWFGVESSFSSLTASATITDTQDGVSASFQRLGVLATSGWEFYSAVSGSVSSMTAFCYGESLTPPAPTYMLSTIEPMYSNAYGSVGGNTLPNVAYFPSMDAFGTMHAGADPAKTWAEAEGSFQSMTAEAGEFPRYNAYLFGPSISLSLHATGFSQAANRLDADLFTLSLAGAGGANATGSLFSLALSSTGTLLETGSTALPLFTCTLSSTGTTAYNGAAGLGFFSSTITAYGGARAALTVPTFTLSAAGVNPATGEADLPLWEFSFTGTGTKATTGTTELPFAAFNLAYASFSGVLPLFSLSSAGSDAVSNAVAYVMNVHTQESTKYSNFGFLHIVNIGGKPYGVKADGLYLLEGTTDYGVAINGTVSTKETDFGSFHSKNVPTVYLNSDTLTTITPIVDAVTHPAYSSTFGGRKTLIARGVTGRYWRFKIDGIQQLEGVEFLPETRQKRVK